MLTIKETQIKNQESCKLNQDMLNYLQADGIISIYNDRNSKIKEYTKAHLMDVNGYTIFNYDDKYYIYLDITGQVVKIVNTLPEVAAFIKGVE